MGDCHMSQQEAPAAGILAGGAGRGAAEFRGRAGVSGPRRVTDKMLASESRSGPSTSPAAPREVEALIRRLREEWPGEEPPRDRPHAPARVDLRRESHEPRESPNLQGLRIACLPSRGN